MNTGRFDEWLRSLNVTPSRRNVLRGLTGLSLTTSVGILDLTESEAGRKRRRRRRRRRKPNRPHICQGRDACDGGVPMCSTSDPNCFCFVDAEGDPICAKGNTVASCEQCQQQFPGRLCFPGTGDQCGAFGCVVECLD